METVLHIHQSFFPLFSGRNCTQELFPIITGEVYRSINGALLHCNDAFPSKYRTILRGQDQCPPALDRLYRGAIVQVDCVQPLIQHGCISDTSLILTRPPVPESVRVFGQDRKPLDYHLTDGAVSLTTPATGGWMVHYRPSLQMMVLSSNLTTQEKSGIVSWEITLEEV